MAQASQHGNDRSIPAGLVEQLVALPFAQIRDEAIARARHHRDRRAFDDRDIQRQIAVELLRASVLA